MSKKATKEGTQKRRTFDNVQRRREKHAENHPNDTAMHQKRIPVRENPAERQRVARDGNGDFKFTEKTVKSSLDNARRWTKKP